VQFAEGKSVRVQADGERGAQLLRVFGVSQNCQSVFPESVQGAEVAHVSGGSTAVLHGDREADHRLPEHQPGAPKRLHTAPPRAQEPARPGEREQQYR